MSGTRNETGKEAGNKADRSSLRRQKDSLMVHLGFSLVHVRSRRPLWLGVEAGTWLACGGYGLWWE